MRTAFLAGLLILTASAPALAVENRPSPVRPDPAVTRSQQDALSTAQGAEARRRDEERRKRWEDRMRRTARSVCDRC